MKHIALIALSESFDDGQLQKVREAGFDHRLLKSADPNDIKSILASLEHAKQTRSDGRIS